MRLPQDDPPRRIFKFVSLPAALAILRGQTIRFSSPLLFNDPFDCQLRVKPGFKHGDLTGYMLERVKPFVRDGTPIPAEASPFFHHIYHDLRLKAEIGSADILTPSNFQNSCPELLADYWEDPLEWYPKFRGMRIAAFSETNSPITMWSHYSDQHRGICLEFDAEQGGLFKLARRVSYNSELPQFATAEQFGEFMLGLLPQDSLRDIFADYLLRKSTEWKYESEWRIITEQTKADELFLDVEFDASALKGVYFGIRTSELDQQLLKSVCFKRYTVQFWLAKRSSDSFSLVFQETLPF